MAERLDTPRAGKKKWFRRTGPTETDSFGKFAEKFARFMGTPAFILYMTVFVVLWVIANLLLSWYMGGDENNPFDPYPFILLNLAFSTQASYSAPLILLAQNRQEDRDRVTAEQDRRRAARNLADTEYLTREIASLRMALNEVATRDFVRSELRDLKDDLREELNQAASAELEAKLAKRWEND